MMDYNKYIDGLMAECQRSLQRSSYQPQYPHIPPQYFATPRTPVPSYTFTKPPGMAPRPCISMDLPPTATASTAYKPSNALPVPPVPQPYVPKFTPLPAAGPRPNAPNNSSPAKTASQPCVSALPSPAATSRSGSSRDLSPTAVALDPNINKNVPPGATAPRSAISRNLSPAATASSTFVPSFQLPIANSVSAYASQKTNEPTIPIGHARPRQDTREGCTKGKPDKESHTHYKNMFQDAMRKELKARGLLCHGPNADLVKRLEKDDIFQATPRTAENYDTMNPKDIHNLCVRRSIPSQGTVSSLKDRLEAHDRREIGIEDAEPSSIPLTVSSGPLPALEVKASQEMLEEEPLVQTVKDEPSSVTEVVKMFEETAETVALTKPIQSMECKPMFGMLLGQNIHRACSECRSSHRRCIHDMNGNVDPVKATEPAIPRPSACKAYIKDRPSPIAKKPTLAIQEVAPTRTIRLRLSQPSVSASQNDKKPTLAIETLAEMRVTRSRAPEPKASASQNELNRPVGSGRIRKDVKRNDKEPKSRRTQLFFQPKDEIILLQICVKLKDVIAWGNISGFWNMVQDTLQLKTGKPYKKVSRHVRILVRNRLAEQQDIEQRGKISISRVSAGCRPLIDRWIAGGNRVNHISPNSSYTSTLIEDKNNMSLGEEGRHQLDPDDFALEVQKRSATDAWLDTSCDTTPCKKLKLCTSELPSGTSKSSADSIGCWSLSGSSVSSESSLEDESEDEDEDEDEDESGDYYFTGVQSGSEEEFVTEESGVTSRGCQ